jgi:hypothetical protein
MCVFLRAALYQSHGGRAKSLTRGNDGVGEQDVRDGMAKSYPDRAAKKSG